jgi:hypothetical protein
VLPDQDIRLPAWLTYHPYDCFAARVTFWTNGPEGVTWIFAWDLLAAGLTGPAGRGDVRVGPEPGDSANLLLTVGSGAGGEQASLRLPAADVRAFVTEVAERVDADKHAVPQALDDELAHIMECA